MGRAMKFNRNRRDANEEALLTIAEQFGAQWVEEGPLDGWVWFRGQWLGPAEIKLPEREGTAREYTPKQKRFLTWCRNHGARWLIWRTTDDVVRDLNRKVTI